MSQTTGTVTGTQQQEVKPAVALANVTGNPGSTFAGIGTLLLGASQAIQQGGLPTSTGGWVTFALAMFGGLLGMLGK